MGNTDKSGREAAGEVIRQFAWNIAGALSVPNGRPSGRRGGGTGGARPPSGTSRGGKR